MKQAMWNRRDLLRAVNLAAGACGTLGLRRPLIGSPSESYLKLPDRFRSARTVNTAGEKQNSRTTFCELEGPGCIQHIWVSVRANLMANRNIIVI
jgi:hypothetical protein